jgi:hypothetical protein
MTGAMMRPHLKAGQRLSVLDQDVDPHQMLEFAGPMRLHMGAPMMMNHRTTIAFTKKGVYRLGTTTVEMPAAAWTSRPSAPQQAATGGDGRVAKKKDSPLPFACWVRERLSPHGSRSRDYPARRHAFTFRTERSGAEMSNQRIRESAADYAVVWRAGDGPTASGGLRIGSDQIALQGASEPEDLRIPLDDLASVEIGHGAGERINGQKSVVLKRHLGERVLVGGLGGVGFVGELCDLLARLPAERAALARVP